MNIDTHIDINIFTISKKKIDFHFILSIVLAHAKVQVTTIMPLEDTLIYIYIYISFTMTTLSCDHTNY